MYNALEPDKIVRTLVRLEERIYERFPNAGLGRVCGELASIARSAEGRARSIARPAYGLRVLTVAMIIGGLGMLGYLASLLVADKRGTDDLYATIQAVEATFNIVVLTGAAIYFLVRIEERVKRGRALTALNELRSIVHVIDMHQLTKDPMMIDAPRTSSSPERNMTAFELTRYLDYCSEMLSLVAKVGALYGQSTSDAVVIDAASDLSTLTTGLSSKIWQKITLVQASGRSGWGAHDGRIVGHAAPPGDLMVSGL